MTHRTATRAEIDLVLDWAADEGWNPGLDDADAFFRADPQGFFVSVVDDQPVAAISVVNHDDTNAFLGLYLCRPAYRGQGHGYALWHHALEHAGPRTIGLDGVPDQQANYARSGFARTAQTVRFAGQLEPASVAAGATPIPVSALIAADQAGTGHARDAFAQAWFRDTETRRTVVVPSDPSSPAFATFRCCRDGIKIGPFHAHDSDQARALLASCPFDVSGRPVFVDVPDASTALTELMHTLTFKPVFHTARMYRGVPPRARPPRFFAGATLELG